MSVPAQDAKWVQVIAPVAIVDNASWTTAEIDTQGYDYCEISFSLGANDIAMTALKVQESDTSGSGFTDITGTIMGTDNNISGSASTLPSATDDNKLFVFHIDCRKRKRYLDLVATNGNGTSGGFASAQARLSRSESGRLTASDMGASQVMRV